MQQRFLIDKITNSIESRLTGESFQTTLTAVSEKEVKSIFKKDGWEFNWRQEYKRNSHKIYKLTLFNDQALQGLISFEPMDNFIEMHLVENAPHNKGDKREYFGVAGNMVAFVCKMSFELGLEGCVAFTAKKNVINHYREALGAQLIYGHQRMGIFRDSAKKLVTSYYKDFFNGR